MSQPGTTQTNFIDDNNEGSLPGDAGMIIPNESTEVTVSRVIRHLSADHGGYAMIYTIHPLGIQDGGN